MESENTVHFTTIIHNSDKGRYIEVPPIYAEMFKSEDKSRRVVCTLGDVEFPCAIMPLGTGWMIMVNKDRQKKLGFTEGMLVEVGLRQDNSQYGMPFPEELQEVLAQDDIAQSYFEALTAGKKRSLMHLVNNVKNVDTRIERALMIAQRLRETKGVVKANEFWGG